MESPKYFVIVKYSFLEIRKKVTVYYSIIEQASGKALDATSGGDVVLYSYHGGENQLWSWEDVNKTTLVNKKYNNKLVLTYQGV